MAGAEVEAEKVISYTVFFPDHYPSKSLAIKKARLERGIESL